ncbi:ADP-ribosylglycohydrolase family protein [Candidatus Poribacteria bacterium]|nr:ADP-ribosylglycohydrolase family protein [Candidatus Poribacteria bacterium]
MIIKDDYEERVYAGVLGKIIGVYVGRPFEGWAYEHIMEQLGEINYYVHEKLGKPLIVTDDDISGTFTFFRALADNDYDPDLTAEQIGQTWLNYLVEGRTVLWWGGMGNSTEHTAYLRLKSGIPAPLSGSIETNSKVVAEQIGAQIFIDAWAMACPGDPEMAVNFAKKAGSVSHDGEALYGAEVLVALESLAFVESDSDKMLDTAVSFIPDDSVIYRMIGDIRDWHKKNDNWRKTRELIVANYGYDKYGGNCHMVPNHALIILGFLYSEDDFQKALMITNTSGWDTDCNGGNIGCLMGIKLGLEGINAGPDWRSPVADKLYLPTADGGRTITDAVRESEEIIKAARKLSGTEFTPHKDCARYHFEFPGSVQGFTVEDSPESRGTATIENIEGRSSCGHRSLAIHFNGVAKGRQARIATPTFMPPDAINMSGYSLYSSPTLYPGQTIKARLVVDSGNKKAVRCCPYIRLYHGENNHLVLRRGETRDMSSGSEWNITWDIEPTDGHPIAEVGVEISSEKRADGTVYLDYLTWDGTPEFSFIRPEGGGSVWQQAWVNAVDSQVHFIGKDLPLCRIIQNEGTGMLIQGTREWKNYNFEGMVNPHMAASSGIAVCVQGLKRYYALLLCNDNKIRLVKERYGQTILAEKEIEVILDKNYQLGLKTNGSELTAMLNDQVLFHCKDSEKPLLSGSIALVCQEGRVSFGYLRIHNK